VKSAPNCYLCGSPGRPLYSGLTDRRYGVEGRWSMSECPSRSCGLIWLDPMPFQSDIGRAYQSYHTHETSAPNPFLRLHEAIGEAYVRRRYGYSRRDGLLLYLLALLNPGGLAEFGRSVVYLDAPKAGGKLLDVGCGNGALLLRMKRLGWDVRGVEPDAVANDIARSKGLDVYQGDLQSAAYESQTFNAICMSHVIEHVHDPIGLLAECRRILKPGGILVAITPNAASLGHRLAQNTWFALDPPRHLMIFKASNLGRIADSGGFAVAQLRSTATGARGIWRRSRPDHGSTGLIFQLRERIAILLGHEIGEELVLMAHPRPV